jgi:hypothetical protein
MKPVYDDRPSASQSSTFFVNAELYLTWANKAARYNNKSLYERAAGVIPQAVLIAHLKTVTTQNIHTTASEVSCPFCSIISAKHQDKWQEIMMK